VQHAFVSSGRISDAFNASVQRGCCKKQCNKPRSTACLSPCRQPCSPCHRSANQEQDITQRTQHTPTSWLLRQESKWSLPAMRRGPWDLRCWQHVGHVRVTGVLCEHFELLNRSTRDATSSWRFTRMAVSRNQKCSEQQAGRPVTLHQLQDGMRHSSDHFQQHKARTRTRE
jgi:hypothetical protein